MIYKVVKDGKKGVGALVRIIGTDTVGRIVKRWGYRIKIEIPDRAEPFNVEFRNIFDVQEVTA